MNAAMATRMSAGDTHASLTKPGIGIADRNKEG